MNTTMQAIHVTRIGEPEVLQPVTIARPTQEAGEALTKYESLGVRGVVVPYGIVGGKYLPFDLLSLVERSRIVAGLLFFDLVRQRSSMLTKKVGSNLKLPT